MRRKLKSLIVSGRNHIWNKQYLLSDAYKAGVEWLLEARERLDRNRSAVSESLADTRIMEAKKLHDHYLDHRY